MANSTTITMDREEKEALAAIIKKKGFRSFPEFFRDIIRKEGETNARNETDPKFNA